jgi:membrane protein YqaA with SNARE-associated domain
VQSLIQHLYVFFAHLGAFGLVLLGILDSSFLMMPLGNDLLLVGLTSLHHDRLIFYIPMAVLGSTLGVLLLDLVLRGTGEEGLKKHISGKRVEYLKKKVSDRAGFAVALAAIAPPPFPFTPVIAAASAFNYPRWKLLSVIAGTRLVRFTIIGFLAIWLGRHILTLAKTPAFVWTMAGFIGLCVAGSAYSIYGWVYRSRRK